jgi:phenylacetate-CoA ligase
MQRFVQKFIALRPPLLQGYVGAIDHLASYIEENRWDVPAPKAIWVTSSPVSAVQRRRIERIFGAPVYDQYGCGEVFWLAAQCGARGGLHINHEGRFIEFVDSDGHDCPRGQTGRILITDLDNRLFPLIRYENGDQGRRGAETCPCGINLPLMDQVRGRMTDMIHLPDRGCISGDYLTTIFDKYPDAVKGFQIRQEADYSLRLFYVPQAEGFELEEVLRKVNAEVRKRTQEKVAVTMEAVEAIPHAEGKLRYVTSDVRTGEN